MSEQQSEQTSTTTTATDTTPGIAWGQPISPERQAELQGYLDRWQAETDHGERKGPFAQVHLTGADVSWLAEQSRHDEVGRLLDLHLEAAYLSRAHLEAAYLVGVHLEAAYLNGAYLEDANLIMAHLERANLHAAHLERANLVGAHLERANLVGAHLDGASLEEAHLEDANLIWTHLEAAYLNGARLEDANLYQAHLDGANLYQAHLAHADLTGAWFDKVSILNDAILTSVSLDQVRFDQTNLTVVDWSLVTMLGDEQTARTPKGKSGKPKDRKTRLTEYKRAVRANRILTVDLQAQGLSEDASRFAYHAQVLQREVYRRQRKVGAYLFSLLIAALSGYGYRLGRILIAYGLALAVFAAAYFTAGQWFGATHLTWYQSILVSLTAIHGRVFFESFGLNSIQSWIAAVESVVGIVIEGVFVAMLIQRFFGR